MHPQAIEVTKQVMEMMNLTAQSMLMSKMFYLPKVTLGEKKVMDKLQKSQNAVHSVTECGFEGIK